MPPRKTSSFLQPSLRRASAQALLARQPLSVLAEFYLLIEAPQATADHPLRLHAVAHDVYTPGSAYTDGQPWSGDLTFRAFYDYHSFLLLKDLGQGLKDIWLFLPAAVGPIGTNIFTLPETDGGRGGSGSKCTTRVTWPWQVDRQRWPSAADPDGRRLSAGSPNPSVCATRTLRRWCLRCVDRTAARSSRDRCRRAAR